MNVTETEAYLTQCLLTAEVTTEKTSEVLSRLLLLMCEVQPSYVSQVTDQMEEAEVEAAFYRNLTPSRARTVFKRYRS